MNRFPRKSLLGAFALAATLAVPQVFAQDAGAEQAPPTDTTTSDAHAGHADEQQASQMDTTTGTETQTASEYQGDAQDAATAATGEPGATSWSQVDTDGDGNLSRAEAGTIPALGELFDQADADADGSLSAEEYRAYAETQGAVDGGGQ